MVIQAPDPDLNVIGWRHAASGCAPVWAEEDTREAIFLVAVAKDPYSGNQDRIQIVKGWLDASGDLLRGPWPGPAARHRWPVAAAGNTADVASATWANFIGAPQLITAWEDPNFDPSIRAFYYARFIETDPR